MDNWFLFTIYYAARFFWLFRVSPSVIWSKNEGKVCVGCGHYVTGFEISAFTLREIRFDVIRIILLKKNTVKNWKRLKIITWLFTDVSFDIVDGSVDVLTNFVDRLDTGHKGRSAVDATRVGERGASWPGGRLPLFLLKIQF